MAYTQAEANRMMERIREIEERKEHEYAAPTYRDREALKEIESIVEKRMAEGERDRETLEDSMVALRYLGNSYESMWRIKYAQKHYNALIALHAELACRFDQRDREAKNDYYLALRARNYYGKDPCLDLVKLAESFLAEDSRATVEKEILQEYRPLKHDPIELTQAYLSVIDEVEREMDTPEGKRMHSFEKNECFQRLLRKRGVHWHTMMELNPGVHFD